MKWILIECLVIFTLVSKIARSQEDPFRINITNFQNCDDVNLDDVGVYITSVSYECDSFGICNTIHGEYTVKFVDTRSKELIITMYQCTTDTIGQCNDNPVEHHLLMHCSKFIDDDSGPWHMLSNAMSGSRCGEEKGDFQLISSKLRYDYLVNNYKTYLILDDNMRKYRSKLLFHVEGKKLTRACVSIDFTIFPV
uniref:Putative secreted protein n=1 Tax=Phlebotomus kandelakii TaxID=1109342 RepID=A0A6B2E9V3_9DIPT